MSDQNTEQKPEHEKRIREALTEVCSLDPHESSTTEWNAALRKCAAALSEAKAGGWVAVQGEPVAWMNDEGDVELSHKPWMSSVWTPLYALPNPPKGEV